LQLWNANFENAILNDIEKWQNCNYNYCNYDEIKFACEIAILKLQFCHFEIAILPF